MGGLYEKYKLDVLNYLFFLTRDADKAQELLQETFLKASAGILTFRYQCSVKTWLFSVARSCFIDDLRKKRPNIQLDNEVLLTICAVSNSLENRIENMDLIERLFEALDERSKTAVIKRSCGFSFREIALYLERVTDMGGLYEKYKLDVLNYLFFLTRDSYKAQELLQETFLKASARILTFRFQCSVKSWLFSIARSCFIDDLRKKRPNIQLDDEVLLTVCTVSDSFENRIENMDLIERLFKALNERSKTAVIKRSCGFSFREIALYLDMSENSARVLYHRAVKKLITFADKNGLKP